MEPLKLLSEMYTSTVRKEPLGSEDLEHSTAIIVEEMQTSCMNLKNKLLLMTVLKRLFMNHDVYLDFCVQLVNQGIFTYMMVSHIKLFYL